MNRTRMVLLGLLLAVGGPLHAVQAWKESTYMVAQLPPAQGLPSVQAGWQLYAEVKLASVASLTRVEQHPVNGVSTITWITEGTAVTQEPDGSLAISPKHDFEMPARPSSAEWKQLEPIVRFEAGGKNIQVFDLTSKGGAVSRIWVDAGSSQVIARAFGRFVSLFQDDELPSQLQLPAGLQASIKEFKRKRQKAALVGVMP